MFQGCRPKFWKSQSHLGCWPAPYTPDSAVVAVFTIPGCVNDCTYGRGKNAVNILDLTFLRALGLGSAKGDRTDLCERTGYLLKEGVAALLNAQNPAIVFPETPAQVIADVNAALATCDPQTIQDLAIQLDAFNSAGCPLNTRSCGP